MPDTILFERENDGFSDPYRNTRLHVKTGAIHFGIWGQLNITLDGDEEEVKVQEGLEGQLDTIAAAVYGDRALWRVIAAANLIDFPLEQVTVGMYLRIPKPAKVHAALQEAITRSSQVEVGDAASQGG